MKVNGNNPRWRFLFSGGCIVYAIWVVFLSGNDFGRVHREYRKAGERLQPVRIEKIAREELYALCREDTLRTTGQLPDREDICLSQPQSALAERELVVAERLGEERSRAKRKLLIFYLSFVFIFVLAPPVVVYFLALFFIRVFASVKVVKGDR